MLLCRLLASGQLGELALRRGGFPSKEAFSLLMIPRCRCGGCGKKESGRDMGRGVKVWGACVRVQVVFAWELNLSSCFKKIKKGGGRRKGGKGRKGGRRDNSKRAHKWLLNNDWAFDCGMTLVTDCDCVTDTV